MAKHIPLKHLTRINGGVSSDDNPEWTDADFARAHSVRGDKHIRAIRDRLNGPAAHRRIPESRLDTFVCAACVAMVAFLLMVSV